MMLPSSARVLFRLQSHVAKFATCSSIPKPLQLQQCRFLSQTSNPAPPPHPQSHQQDNITDKTSSTLINTAVPSPSSPQTISSLSSSLSTEVEDNSVEKLYKTIELEVLAYEPSILDSYQWFVMSSAKYLSIPVGKIWSPNKSEKQRFPLLKSAFVHKKHQVHYEIRTYHRFITLHHLTSSTASTFLEYIERNLPEGCGLKVTKVMVQPLPKFLAKSG